MDGTRSLQLDAESLRVDRRVGSGGAWYLLASAHLPRFYPRSRGAGLRRGGTGSRPFRLRERSGRLPLVHKTVSFYRYSDFEFYQRCLAAARIEAAGRLVGPDVDERLERWRQDLRDLARRRDLDLSPGFADSDLLTAVSEFSRKRFGNRFRGSLRYDMNWKRDILPLVVEAHGRISDSSDGTAQAEQLDDRIRQRTDEHALYYPLMSNELHGSPMAVAERVRDYPSFRLGGDPQRVPNTVAIAVGCFDRLRTLVRYRVVVPDGDAE